MSKTLLAFAASLLLAGAAAAQTGPVTVTNAWARATPGKAANGAAYVTLEAASPDRLVGVSTPVAAKAELHEMKLEGTIMKMRALSGIDLPAGKPVAMKPGGIHIMLLGLKAPLHAGQTFPLTLDFQHSGRREVNVRVAGVGAMRPPNRSGGSMPTPMHH